MLLNLSTWPEVETYLDRSQAIIVPIGSTEQHGPVGLIGTDSICAEVIAQGVGDAVAAMVGPTINVGMALHHTNFPGSISLKPSTMLLVIRDYITSLAKTGFVKFFFINGHGGNIATMKAAFSETYAHLEELKVPKSDLVQCRVGNWFMCSSVIKLARELYGDKEGSHATPSEVALTRYAYPNVIKEATMSELVNQHHEIYGAIDFRRRYPDGRMGSDSSLGTAEHGKKFYDLAVKEMSNDYLQFLNSH